MIKQLYTFFTDIEYPCSSYCDRTTGEILESITYPGYFAVTWPNRTPCFLVEMFLLDRSKFVKVNKFDGGTLKGYVSHLTHLIRFCYSNNKDFWLLNDNDIDLFSKKLVNERTEYGHQKRDNNTTKSIIATCILFLKWLQNNICIDRNITGIDNTARRYQIKLVVKTHTDEKGRIYKSEVFPSELPDAITSPKQPISSHSIKLLWDALIEIRSNAVCSNKLKSRFTRKQQINHLDYMNKRRELQLSLL